MIISKNIYIKISKKTITYFKNKGYKNISINDKINIDVNDLSEGSHVKIKVKCDICGYEKEIMYQKYIKNMKNGGYYSCSSKCSQEKVKNTTLKTYGKEYYTQTTEYKNSYEKTSLERYGVKHHTQSKVIKDKIKNTNIQKYGVENVSKSKLIKDKIKNTFIEKYNIDNISKLDKIKIMISDKNKSNSKIRLNKSKNTILKKYGVSNISKLKSIKDKIKNTNIQKYGVENVLLLDVNKKKSILSKLTNWKNNKIYEDDNIVDIDIINKKIIYECNKKHITNIPYKTYYNRMMSKTIICTKCNSIQIKRSGLEIQLFNFIKENYCNKIIVNSKSIIPPYELDIYLPELNLAFEFNGLYWHSELYKPNDYHKIKTELCNEKNIQLIHIYEDDWLYKNDIIKSIILNKLGKNTNRIYARSCKIKEITDNGLIKYFLNENHIQGVVGSSIKIGLFFEDELVSLMTFGKLRLPLKSISEDKQYEMLRFCNKLNTNIIGGASKLFKYFILNYNPTEVISYVDRNYSNGKLYNKLGFTLNSITSPNYYYIIDGIRNYRFNFRKNILIKEGFDKNKTEHEIMLERKIYRIYNSGNYKFIYKKPN